jgi:hypothetical protein
MLIQFVPGIFLNYFFFAVLGFELRASCLLGISHALSLVTLVIFETGREMFLLVSASRPMS